MSDWKLNTVLFNASELPRQRAIGSAATWRHGGDIGTADPARCQILGVGGRAAAQHLARRPVPPAIANPHHSDDQDEQDEFRKCEHLRGLPVASKPGQGTLRNRDTLTIQIWPTAAVPQSTRRARRSSAGVRGRRTARGRERASAVFPPKQGAASPCYHSGRATRREA